MLPVHVKNKPSIDEEALAAGRRLHRAADTPTIDELRSYLEASQKADTHILLVSHGDKPVGLSICFRSYDRVHGIRLRTYRNLGYQLYDYNELLHAPGHALTLIEAMKRDARKAGCDAILLDNMSASIEGLEKNAICVVQDLKVAHLSQVPAHNVILAKKSFKRDAGAFRRQPGYRVVHRLGNFGREDLAAIACLHNERWHFDGVISAFASNPRRSDEYAAHTSNKLLTLIYVGEELVAGHFGMLFADRLIFHTPVVNVKLLQRSPMKLLLYELALWCAENRVSVLDLGLGDEDYKLGISNGSRQAFSYLLPLTAKGWLASMGRQLATEERKAKVRAIAARFRVRREAAGRAEPRCWLRAGSHEMPREGGATCSLNVITQYPDFIDAARAFGLRPRRDHFNRFKDGQVFVALMRDGTLAACGWGAPAQAEAGARAPTLTWVEPDTPESGEALIEFLTALDSQFPACKVHLSATVNGATRASLLRAGFRPCSLETQHQASGHSGAANQAQGAT